jgi:hypothetical protein
MGCGVGVGVGVGTGVGAGVGVVGEPPAQAEHRSARPSRKLGSLRRFPNLLQDPFSDAANVVDLFGRLLCDFVEDVAERALCRLGFARDFGEVNERHRWAFSNGRRKATAIV